MKIKDKDLDKMLELYAKENSGKYGTDEQMFEDLKADFAEEKAKKKLESSLKRKEFFKRAWIPATSLAFVAILTLTLLWQFVWKGSNFNISVESLTFTNVTRQQLIDRVGEDVIIPEPDYYDVAEYRIAEYKGRIACYDITYRTTDYEITLTIILIDNCVYNRLDILLLSGFLENYNGVNVEKQSVTSNRTVCKFGYDDKLIYMELRDYPELMNSFLQKILK